MTTTQHTTEEAGIRERIDKLVVAVRAMDLESVMSMYAPDIVSSRHRATAAARGGRGKGKELGTRV